LKRAAVVSVEPVKPVEPVEEPINSEFQMQNFESVHLNTDLVAAKAPPRDPCFRREYVDAMLRA
jgi:hypothetical protein